ncbi:hypothetical protein BHE74_00037868 [Ensete ventricosum]|nr:hypothetical protein BHE74_00037868 [Ensete ventricosum]
MVLDVTLTTRYKTVLLVDTEIKSIHVGRPLVYPKVTLLRSHPWSVCFAQERNNPEREGRQRAQDEDTAPAITCPQMSDDDSKQRGEHADADALENWKWLASTRRPVEFCDPQLVISVKHESAMEGPIHEVGLSTNVTTMERRCMWPGLHVEKQK